MCCVHYPIATTHDSRSGVTDNILDDYTAYLKSLYVAKTLASSSDDQWPPPVTHKIFRLAMVKTEEHEIVRRGNIDDDLVREKTITGKVDDILQLKVSIELKDVFRKTVGPQKKVLMEGAPGCGKSILSLHICHQWTDGLLFQEYKLVVLVRLRDSTIQHAKSIADLLPQQNIAMGQDVEKEITTINGRGVLFVLDGWDELPQNVPGHSIILNLIKGAQLQESSIIVTSRQTSSASLQLLVSSRIEILGFTRDELRQYFIGCLQNVKAVENLLQRIKENPILEGSCYLPLNASILVHLFKCGGNKLPTTQYGIFSELVCTCIFRHLKKTQQDISELKSLDDLPPAVDGPFQHLCEIAYKGVMDDKVVFDLGSGFNTLGLLQGVESFVRRGISHSYNFLHLSVQELLAAIYIGTKLEPHEQAEQFKKLFGKARFSAVFQFYAAKTKLQARGINDIVIQVVKKCAVRIPNSEDTALLLSLLHCLFEAQDSTLCQLVVGQLRSKLKLGGTKLNLADCHSVRYFLVQLKDFDVHLSSCSIGDDMCKILFKRGEIYNFRTLKYVVGMNWVDQLASRKTCFML